MKHTSDEQQGYWSRRSFVGTAGVGVAGLGAAAARVGGETLAIDGGAKAVSVPSARQRDIFKWPRYGEREKRGVAALLESNKFYDEIEPLEAVCRDYHGVPHAKAHCNGTSALMSMFFALGLPTDSEIMVPSYTASATIAPMRFFGCVPIFVDIDPLTACFDLEDARRRLTPLTRALVVMHSWGLPCEMDHIAAFAKEQGLILLEDSAQAFGASMQGKPMGAWGAIGMHSFQASKTVAAVEGGMGLYQTREYYERATAFGNYDLPRRFPENSPYRKYHDTGFGPKFRIHPIAALLARLQIEGVDERNDRLRARTRALNERLTALPGLSIPRSRPEMKRVHWAANILFFDEKKAGFSREAARKALRAEGVQASTAAYPEQHKFTIYREPQWWSHAPEVPDHLPGCEQVNGSTLRLRLFHDDEPELMEQYVRAFEKVWAGRARLTKM